MNVSAWPLKGSNDNRSQKTLIADEKNPHGSSTRRSRPSKNARNSLRLVIPRALHSWITASGITLKAAMKEKGGGSLISPALRSSSQKSHGLAGPGPGGGGSGPQVSFTGKTSVPATPRAIPENNAWSLLPMSCVEDEPTGGSRERVALGSKTTCIPPRGSGGCGARCTCLGAAPGISVLA